jgi:hypothetical protein
MPSADTRRMRGFTWGSSKGSAWPDAGKPAVVFRETGRTVPGDKKLLLALLRELELPPTMLALYRVSGRSRDRWREHGARGGEAADDRRLQPVRRPKPRPVYEKNSGGDISAISTLPITEDIWDARRHPERSWVEWLGCSFLPVPVL